MQAKYTLQVARVVAQHLLVFRLQPGAVVPRCSQQRGVAALVVRGLLRRSSLSGTLTVTFCSVHVHNVVAKKSDASTSLLRRLHAHTVQYNVDFFGGDFNMSAFSTVGEVFIDPEFAAPDNSLLWSLVGFVDARRECTGFLIMAKRPYGWRDDDHGCYKCDNAELGFGPRDETAHLPAHLHLRAPPTCLALTASRAVPRPSIGAWIELRVTTSANGSASNSLSIQHHDLPVPSVRENITC